MKYVGVDLRKKALALCVVTSKEGKQRVVERKPLAFHDVAWIAGVFQALPIAKAKRPPNWHGTSISARVPTWNRSRRGRQSNNGASRRWGRLQ